MAPPATDQLSHPHVLPEHLQRARPGADARDLRMRARTLADSSPTIERARDEDTEHAHDSPAGHLDRAHRSAASLSCRAGAGTARFSGRDVVVHPLAIRGLLLRGRSSAQNCSRRLGVMKTAEAVLVGPQPSSVPRFVSSRILVK